MKTIVIVATLVASCTAHVISRDHSPDLESQSRYVWMPDAKGTPVLVDLDEPVDEELLKTRNGINNQYWLHTRRNPHFPQVIVHGNHSTILGSNYNGDRVLNVIVHGWSGEDLNAPSNPNTTSALLAAQDCNVIVVDWRAVANANYLTAVAGVPSVGKHLGNFLIWLINTAGGNWNQVHLIGFGMGAHVVGTAGHYANRRPARITGLDPAGYGWHSNPNRLSRNDGQYVEAIHTDGHGLGILDPCGDADFYPDRGLHPQLGCFSNMCSHNRATDLFESTVRFNNLNGRECADFSHVLQGSCNGAEFPMGNSNVNKRGSGIYYLRGRASWPF